MSRFLFTVWPFAGHVNPNMALALALKANGHQVAGYSGPSVQAVFEKEGLEFFPFQEVQEEPLRKMLLSGAAARSPVWHPLERVRMLRSWLVDTLPPQIRDQSRIVQGWEPDVVVTDVTMWGVPLILRETRGLPVVVASFVPGCMVSGPDAPPFGLGLARPKNWQARVTVGAVRRTTELLARGVRRRVNELRRQYGLSPLVMDIQSFLGTMELYLVPCTPEFDYARKDLPASVHYVGSVVWNKHSADPPPGWLAQLPSDRPLVHVTEGTMHAGRPFLLEAAARALADSPCYVLMTSGKDRDPSSIGLGTLPANVRLESWVPHTDLLPRTDIMITTGGGGTIVAGLEAGVPMIVVPTQWDKPENAQRVVESGVGLRIDPSRCTAARLRAAVQRILSDPSFREKALGAARDMASRGGVSRAVGLIEGVLKRRRPPLRAAAGSLT